MRYVMHCYCFIYSTLNLTHTHIYIYIYIYISTEGLGALQMHLLLNIALKFMCVYYVIYIYPIATLSLFCGIQRLCVCVCVCVCVYQSTYERICVSMHVCEWYVFQT